MLARFERITPRMARELIAVNTNLCPLNEKKVKRFARRMRWGLWKDSEDPIIVNDLGYLTDGQHRLHACAESGKPFEARLIRGGQDVGVAALPQMIYEDVDLSRVVDIIWRMEKSGNRYECDVPVGSDYLLLARQIRRELRKSVDAISDFRRLSPTPEICVAVHWVLCGRGRDRATEYFKALSESRSGLSRVRTRLRSGEDVERYQIYCLLWGWNCWTTGDWTEFDYEKDSELPRIHNPKGEQ